jgi:uncharacterized flavoprotein (TIGR03862 family)
MTVAVGSVHISSSVAVVGAGPAGLMAADALVAAGHRVTVYEAHRSVGRKFLLAGRSGLNLTHIEPIDRLLDRYTASSPLIADAVRAFPPAAVRAWADELGASTFVGSSGRVFPEVMRAAPLLRSWIQRLSARGVEWRPGHRFVGWEGDTLRFDVSGAMFGAQHPATILSFGGASWPRVSSYGEWADTLAGDGQEVEPLRAANAGLLVDWSPVFRDRFEGVPLKNVVVHFDGEANRGELVITHNGLEGGPVYALASRIREPLSITFDLLPELDADAVRQRLEKRRPKDSASTMLRRVGLAPVAIGLLREATGNDLPRSTEDLVGLIRRVPVFVLGVAPLDRAISTAGGLRLTELTSDFMIARRPGVFAAGEMLDWDAPTGGYLLQACLSTGWVAGNAAARFLGVSVVE